jgi:hypothetical protein
LVPLARYGPFHRQGNHRDYPSLAGRTLLSRGRDRGLAGGFPLVAFSGAGVVTVPLRAPDGSGMDHAMLECLCRGLVSDLYRGCGRLGHAMGLRDLALERVDLVYLAADSCAVRASMR